MCSYLNYDPYCLRVGRLRRFIMPEGANPKLAVGRISYNDEPFTLTFPEDTVVESVERIKKSLHTELVLNNRIVLRIHDPIFKRVCEIICSKISANGRYDTSNLHFKGDYFSVNQTKHDFEKDEFIKPYFRLHVRDVLVSLVAPYTTNIRTEIISVKEEIFELFYLLRFVDILPEIRFEIMKWIFLI